MHPRERLLSPVSVAALENELAQALSAYERYLQFAQRELSFIEKVRVLLRDNDSPTKPIP